MSTAAIKVGVPGLVLFCLEFACSVRDSPKTCMFLDTYRHFKLFVGVNVRANGCFSLCGNSSRLLSYIFPMTARLGSS